LSAELSLNLSELLQAEKFFYKFLQPVFLFGDRVLDDFVVAIFVKQAKAFPAFGQAIEF
jgi:hypothetical protein